MVKLTVKIQYCNYIYFGYSQGFKQFFQGFFESFKALTLVRG